MNYKPEVDLTETPNYGLLNEMSIVELKQRLALAKEAAKKEENRQRELILQRKKEKDQVMRKIKQNIENDRLLRTEQRIKNEKNKAERQKRLDELLNEKMNINKNVEFYPRASRTIHTPTTHFDSIQNLVYQVQQRKERMYKFL